MKRLLPLIPLLLLAACGPKWQETEADGYRLITQKGGATLGVSTAPILQDGGYAFKDLNRNGQLDIYEDWRRPALVRAQDLAAQLSIEEIAGLMLYSGHQSVPGTAYGFGGATYGGKPLAESGANSWDLTDQQRKFLEEDNLRAVLVTTVESPEVAARWNNNVLQLWKFRQRKLSQKLHHNMSVAEANYGYLRFPVEDNRTITSNLLRREDY